MTKIQEWEKMIEKVESHAVSKEEIIRFLKANKPKPKESTKKLPCTCGCGDIRFWWNMKKSTWLLRCAHCDKASEDSKFQIQAIRNWNEMIKKETENNGSEN